MVLFYHSYRNFIRILSQKQSLFFSRLHTPAVIRLIHHTGDKGDDVLRTVAQNAGIVHADLTDRVHFIAACAELGSQLDGVANVKGVDLSEVIVDAPIVARNRHIAFPDGGAGEMSCALAERVRVRPLIHLQTGRGWGFSA